MRRTLRNLVGLATLAFALCATPACKSDPTEAISGGIESVINDLEDWMGGGSLPGELVQKLRSVHEPGTWRLRTDVDGALETARETVRDLGETDLSTWRDAAIVTQILSSIATEHSASLMRVEALDTLRRIAPWTLGAESEPAFVATEESVIDALKVIREAQGKTDSEPAFTAEVLTAVRAVSNFRFDANAAPPPEAPLSRAARSFSGKLANARGVLTAITGSPLEGFRADPEIRDEMDRAYVSLTASVVRATFAAALTGDDTPVVRGTAADRVGDLQLSGLTSELARSLRDDASSSVRRASATALGQFPMEVAVPALMEGLYDDMPDVRGAAARALAATTGESFGVDRDAWSRWWKQRGTSAAPASGTGTGSR